MIRFECDPVKARENQRKHGINFDDAVVLLVAHTVFEGGEVIRLTSARRATRNERKLYEQARQQEVG
jgi:uncharacterized DUF497 family protein